jgi:hypothetical protein
MEVRHSMTERLEECKLCEYQGVLMRIPQLTNIIKKEEQGERSTGSLVKEYIEENKKILNREKKARIKFNE